MVKPVSRLTESDCATSLGDIDGMDLKLLFMDLQSSQKLQTGLCPSTTFDDFYVIGYHPPFKEKERDQKSPYFLKKLATASVTSQIHMIGEESIFSLNSPACSKEILMP